jgi:hypothetical protein
MCLSGQLPIGKRQADVPSSADLLSQDRIQELTDLTGRAFTYIRDTGKHTVHQIIIMCSYVYATCRDQYYFETL